LGKISIVAVWSPDPVVGEGIRFLVGSVPDMAVVPFERLAEASVVVLVDQELTDRLSEAIVLAVTSKARVVVLVDRLSQDDLAEIRGLGADMASRLPISSEQLVNAVRCTHASVAAPMPTSDVTLQERELELLRLLADGCDLAEVARRLAYSPRTVKYILRGVVDTLAVRNRNQAVAYAIRRGLI
jgi:DNA-binding NarL/FixJ family response regulator